MAMVYWLLSLWWNPTWTTAMLELVRWRTWRRHDDVPP
jgi:hypothetical protein